MSIDALINGPAGKLTSTQSSRRNRLWLALSIVFVVLIMVSHYLTDMSNVSAHNVYRRLAYIPIVLAAFSHGAWGGLLTAAAASVAYIPHAFFSHHRDPSPTVDKVAEITLYFVLGGLTGWLVNRRQHARLELERSLAARDALEQQLVRAGKMSALGQMAAGLAHEIRNPLASILGSAESLVAEFDETHRKHKMGRLLLSEIDRLNRVVTECVRFARPSALERSEIDLASVAAHVLELGQSRVEPNRVTTRVKGAPPAPVTADRDQIVQVVLNLLLNAYHALSGSGRDGHVEVRFAQREVAGHGFVGIGVHDDGPGIPAEHRERVFDPYFSTHDDGTGLGLAISNRIVEAHGGFMELDSQPGDTTLWAFLPTT